MLLHLGQQLLPHSEWENHPMLAQNHDLRLGGYHSMKPKKHHIIHKTQSRDRDTNEVYMTLQVCEVTVKVPPPLLYLF